MTREPCPVWALKESARLAALVADRAVVRLARARRLLTAPDLRRVVPAAAPLLRTLSAMLRRMPAAARRLVLHGPDLRGFLGEVETWTTIARAAAVARPGSGRSAGPRSDRRHLALFAKVSRTEHLVLLAPRGRIDAGFAGRAAGYARRRLREVADDLAAFVLGLRLAGADGPDFTAHLTFRADPEQGRPGNRIDLGTVVGPAGPIGLVDPGSTRLRVHAGSRTITLRRTAGAALVRRALVPGSSIVLAPAVRCHPRRLVVAGPLPDAGPRLARALRLVQIAWPEAHREILLRTRLVVPVVEPGTVSWSIAARPGVSFINLRGKTTVDLADDLLHETAHHHLHDRQEIEDLLRHGPDTEEVQAFDSPWRGTRRPLHGILHGAFTFSFRAELFRRLLRARRAHPRVIAPLLAGRSPAWIRSEIRREDGMVAVAVRDLGRAAREGLLTSRGRRLLRALYRPRDRASRAAPRVRAGGRRRGRGSSGRHRPAR